MTKDDIIRMAREAYISEYHLVMLEQGILRFANSVAAAEREECAALCDKLSDEDGFEGSYADRCAFAIRARGDNGL